MSTNCMLIIALTLIRSIVIDRVASQSPTFPALFAFGDSHLDPGNNNYIPTVAKCNFKPYGRDFEGGNPTGRWSNGKMTTDLTAEALGIKELIPPYLNSSLQTSDLLTGVSFASGSSGYDPISAALLNVLNLTAQLKLFKEYKGELNASVGENRTESIISQSLYLMSSGSNDITNTYFPTLFRRVEYDITAYADLLVNFASAFFQDLYGLGARNIGVLSAPPAGCIPTVRFQAGGLQRNCAAQYNLLASTFNTKLQQLLQQLNNTLPGSSFRYLDFYNFTLDLINNGGSQGFIVGNRGCCGSGTIEASILCTSASIGTCVNASTYVFWDSTHLTQHAYQLLANQIVGNYM